MRSTQPPHFRTHCPCVGPDQPRPATGGGQHLPCVHPQRPPSTPALPVSSGPTATPPCTPPHATPVSGQGETGSGGQGLHRRRVCSRAHAAASNPKPRREGERLSRCLPHGPRPREFPADRSGDGERTWDGGAAVARVWSPADASGSPEMNRRSTTLDQIYSKCTKPLRETITHQQ